VPQNHPLRPIRTWVSQALATMEAKFSAMYESDIEGGRPSIAPEKLMRAARRSKMPALRHPKAPEMGLPGLLERQPRAV